MIAVFLVLVELASCNLIGIQFQCIEYCLHNEDGASRLPTKPTVRHRIYSLKRVKFLMLPFPSSCFHAVVNTPATIS